MKYRVMANYIRFAFPEGANALAFAEMAKKYAEDDISVEIEIIEEEADGREKADNQKEM